MLVQRWTELERPDRDGNSRGAGQESTQLRLVLSEWPGEQLILEYHQSDEQLPLCSGGRSLSRFGRELLGRLRLLLAEQQTVPNDLEVTMAHPNNFAALATQG